MKKIAGFVLSVAALAMATPAAAQFQKTRRCSEIPTVSIHYHG